MIDRIKTVQLVAALFATMVACWNLGLPRLVFPPELAPIHRRIEPLEQFNRDTRLLVPDQARWSANPLGIFWPERDAAFVTSDGSGSGSPATARRPLVLIPGGLISDYGAGTRL